MNPLSTRRDFLRTTAAASAGLLLSHPAGAAKNKSVLLFTKSSGFEHAVIKVTNGNPSIAETAIRGFSAQNKFDLTASKDGRIFDSKEFHEYAAVVFFTTGDLTQEGTDKNPPMSTQGKQAFLDAVHNGSGLSESTPLPTRFTRRPTLRIFSNRYIAHGEQSDPYIRMIGGEFIIPRPAERSAFANANVVINDASFPASMDSKSPVSLMEEWYSMKDFAPDLHVNLYVGYFHDERQRLQACVVSGPSGRACTAAAKCSTRRLATAPRIGRTLLL